jgi:hypothetical protein
MPKSRRRLTHRDLMIAVVAFAISLKLGLAYRHSPDYWREAGFQGRMAENFRFYAARFEEGSVIPPDADDRTDAAAKARRFADELDHKRANYLRAAFLPWLPNAPEVPSS